MEGCGTVPKILLVEDNQAAVVKIRQFIENIDTALELLTCKEAGAAYILAQKQKVDLFILDIQLKDYKGTSLAAQLRGLPEYKYTPIIFESALAGEELSAYREVKCYGFLIKPYAAKLLAHRLLPYEPISGPYIGNYFLLILPAFLAARPPYITPHTFACIHNCTS